MRIAIYGGALLAHLALSAYLGWRFKACTAHYSTVPSPAAYVRSRELAARARAQGWPLTPGDVLGLASTTHQTWSIRPWCWLLALGGLAGWLLTVAVRVVLAPPWLP